MLRSQWKLAFKVLLRRKFFTLVSLFGIAFTLAVLTVATAVLDNVFAPRPPESCMDHSLIVLGLSMTGPHASRTSFAGYGFLDRWVRDIPGAEAVTLFTMGTRAESFHDDRKFRIFLKHTDGEFWNVLDFDFVEGAPFDARDDEAGNRVAVLNESTRRRYFGDGPALGRRIEADGQSFRVVGVVRDVPMTRILTSADVYVPIGSMKTDGYRREILGSFSAIVVGQDRDALGAIREEFASRLPRVQLPNPEEFDALHGGADTPFEALSRMLFASRLDEPHPGRLWAVLIGAALAFMLLPAINLMNLNLSRILERAPEIGVRRAFGASRPALVAQFIAENLVLTLVGAALGWLLSVAALDGINSSGWIPYADLGLNFRVLAWATVLAVAFGLLSGVYPAWRMSRLHPVEAIRGRSE